MGRSRGLASGDWVQVPALPRACDRIQILNLRRFHSWRTGLKPCLLPGWWYRLRGAVLANCFTPSNRAKSVLFPLPRHTFWQFRHENPKTRVGGPPPEGLPGFNSGVMLLNLEAMRQSPLYSRLLEPAQVQQLADKYHFRGHLGDQDFFTMIGMEHPELFHVLDCTWNRQLCTWWRDHGYSDVFEAYFRCEGHVRIYHGNCNTPIPEV